MFFKGSRYARVPEAEITTDDGRTVRYKRTRFIPPTPAQREHVVQDGERLDHIAYAEYRDPERFWRICDASTSMRPSELTEEPGRILPIPQAEG